MKRTMRRLALAGCALAAACRDAEAPVAAAGLGVADVLGGTAAATAGFARAVAPPRLSFPRDHGAHPDFRTEWWYVTANLATEAGRRFGVQLVFFRQALAPLAGAAPRRAALAAREVILAHAALTDVDGRRFFAEEQLARAAGGLAAVRGGNGPEDPFAVVCGDWSARAQAGGDGFLPLQLRAAGADFAFELQVTDGKPLVLQGDAGLSQKSSEPGNASIYYSLTRLPIGGQVVLGDQVHRVRGEAWLDREWSTSALSADQVGWDWFSLQLDDGTEVMWYRLRRRDGTPDPWSRGCFVARDGTATPLSPREVEAIPVGEWTASDGEASYPARWLLRGRGAVPFDLEVTPSLPDQELRVIVRYWEGAVEVRGTRAGRPVGGRGYLEMTGYARGS
jgi:predicted secreted hydrolase